jgi:hypothetical protein
LLATGNTAKNLQDAERDQQRSAELDAELVRFRNRNAMGKRVLLRP